MTKDSRPTNLFISWINYHGRSKDLADSIGFAPVFINRRTGPPALRYVMQAASTARMILRHRPKVVAVMLPPLPLLLTVRVLSLVLGYRIIADLHSGVFLNPKWRWALRYTLSAIGRSNVAIVTNSALQDMSTSRVPQTIVLHDLISLPAFEELTSNSPYVLVPLSYANDEPLESLIEAARITPEVRWVLTGNPPTSLRLSAPGNIQFPGYVNVSEYRELLANASVVVALTTRAHTMQRGGYEAISAGRPLVTSNFKELRDYFGDAAQYAESTSESISRAVAIVLSNHDTYVRKMRTLAHTRHAEQESRISELTGWIGQYEESVS
ncbi:glycosyltransferase [Rhodococcus sp. NPDC127530]|uniref:glycosyltransferase n=1 Tax=unclassified Rhodococcus (in: high G+C Gram-positive bacteria) TaxID=192944 RepID=UPI00363651E3